MWWLTADDGGGDFLPSLTQNLQSGAPAGVTDATNYAQGQNGKPYEYGGTDCSGYMSGIYNNLTGQNARFTTDSNFANLGFQPGYNPDSHFNIGTNGGSGEQGHMAGELNGTNVESASATGHHPGATGVMYGGPAYGPQNPIFTQQWHLPNDMVKGVGGNPKPATPSAPPSIAPLDKVGTVNMHNGQYKSGPWLLEASQYFEADVSIDPQVEQNYKLHVKQRNNEDAVHPQSMGPVNGPAAPVQGNWEPNQFGHDWANNEWRGATDGGAFESTVRPRMPSDIPHPRDVLNPNDRRHTEDYDIVQPSVGGASIRTRMRSRMDRYLNSPDPENDPYGQKVPPISVTHIDKNGNETPLPIPEYPDFEGNVHNHVGHHNDMTPEQAEMGKLWYDMSHESTKNLADATHGDQGRVIHTYAAYSPRTSWDENTEKAHHFITNYNGTPESIPQFPGMSDSPTRKAIQIYHLPDGEYQKVNSGPKTGSFAQNIGDPNRVDQNGDYQHPTNPHTGQEDWRGHPDQAVTADTHHVRMQNTPSEGEVGTPAYMQALKDLRYSTPAYFDDSFSVGGKQINPGYDLHARAGWEATRRLNEARERGEDPHGDPHALLPKQVQAGPWGRMTQDLETARNKHMPQSDEYPKTFPQGGSPEDVQNWVEKHPLDERSFGRYQGDGWPDPRPQVAPGRGHGGEGRSTPLRQPTDYPPYPEPGSRAKDFKQWLDNHPSLVKHKQMNEEYKKRKRQGSVVSPWIQQQYADYHYRHAAIQKSWYTPQQQAVKATPRRTIQPRGNPYRQPAGLYHPHGNHIDTPGQITGMHHGELKSGPWLLSASESLEGPGDNIAQDGMPMQLEAAVHRDPHSEYGWQITPGEYEPGDFTQVGQWGDTIPEETAYERLHKNLMDQHEPLGLSGDAASMTHALQEYNRVRDDYHKHGADKRVQEFGGGDGELPVQPWFQPDFVHHGLDGETEDFAKARDYAQFPGEKDPGFRPQIKDMQGREMQGPPTYKPNWTEYDQNVDLNPYGDIPIGVHPGADLSKRRSNRWFVASDNHDDPMEGDGYTEGKPCPPGQVCGSRWITADDSDDVNKDKKKPTSGQSIDQNVPLLENPKAVRGVPSPGSPSSGAAGVSGAGGDKSFAPQHHVPSVQGSGLAAAESLAQQSNGNPYDYGGHGGGDYDCSGFQSDIYNALTGKPLGTREFDTTSNFSNLGFQPGYDPNSSYNIGVNPEPGMSGHMAGDLNGVHVESGGAADATQYGGQAAGATNPEFSQQWHLPNSMIVQPPSQIAASRWLTAAPIPVGPAAPMTPTGNGMGPFGVNETPAGSPKPTGMGHGGPWAGGGGGGGAPTSGGAPGVPGIGGGSNSTPPAGGVTPGGPPNKAEEEQYAQSLFSQHGWGPEQMPALQTLWDHESNWDPSAHNPSGASGIWQGMPYTPGYTPVGTDWHTQIENGEKYIQDRYQNPSAAWNQYYDHPGGEGSY